LHRLTALGTYDTNSRSRWLHAWQRYQPGKSPLTPLCEGRNWGFALLTLARPAKRGVINLNAKSYFTSASIVLLSLLLLMFWAVCSPVDATGPRKEAAQSCSRYDIPEVVLHGTFTFAGEVIPFQVAHVRARVRLQINFLLLDARSVLTGWLMEQTRYAWIFEEEFKREQVPLDFITFAPVLSGLNAGQSTRMQGVGWWALDTVCNSSDGVILTEDSWHDDRMDLELSTRCFALRLKRIKQELGTASWLTAAAAYVTSVKAIREVVTSWKTDKYWDLPLPDNAETLIPRWIALEIIRAHPAEYGLKIRESPPLTFDQVSGLLLAKDLPISEIAVMTGAPPRSILELNPRVKASSGKFPATVGGKALPHKLAAPKGTGWTLVNKLKANGYLVEKPK